MIGVALSIALTVTMFSISEGLRNSTDELVSSTGVDLFIVPKGSDYLFFNVDFIQGTDLTQDIENDLGSDADTVTPRFTPSRQFYVRTADGNGDARSLGAQGNGVIPDTLGEISGFSIVDGKYFTQVDDPFRDDPSFMAGIYDPAFFANFTGEIVVNRALADEMGLKAGDQLVLSSSQSYIDNVTLSVAGVYVADFEGTEFRSFHLRLSELQYMLQRFDDPVTEILVDLANGVDADKSRKVLDNNFVYSPRLTVSTDRDIYNTLGSLFDTFEGFAKLIALITIVVALLFISTVMIISVKERTREIGALRAIGFSRSSIFKQVLIEGIIISLVGFALGLLMGFLDVWALDEFLRRTITGIPEGIHVTEITGVVIMEVTLVALVIGAVAGLLPAYWATRVDIAKTLRQE
ncbi:MAG: FtsX-like permease family protein [Thermoplasmata archaeon]|nr:FtsX-like permease family protein [Thermoplasmata archaeon]